MKTSVIGANSDIARMLMPHLGEVTAYHHDRIAAPVPWDLLLVCSGEMLEGYFDRTAWWEWEKCFDANFLYPLRMMKEHLVYRNDDATVVFFAGTNPNGPALGKSAYHVAKIALIAMAEQLNAELDCSVFIVGPGYVPTKIHSGPQALQETTPQMLIEFFMRCLENRHVLGGRNIHIRDDMHTFSEDLYKLRRCDH